MVTRWFGGTRLGAGGLARAYRDAASRALARLPTVEALPADLCLVVFSHPDTGTVMRLLEAVGARRKETRYEESGASVWLSVLVPTGRARELGRTLRDATRGRVRLELVGEGGLLIDRKRRSGPT